MRAVVAPDYRVVRALNAEWEGLRSGYRDVVQQWARQDPALADCHDLGQVLESIQGDPDGVLFALLKQSRSGHHLAARVVLQAMLGKVVLLARHDAEASEHDYLVALWGRIATYPLTNRPVKIAANLALDTLKLVRRERRPSGGAVTLSAEAQALERLQCLALSRSVDSGADTLTAAGVIETADRLGLLDVVTRDVLLSVYADGLSGGAAADRHRTTPSMVRYRCSRGVRRMAAHSAQLAAA